MVIRRAMTMVELLIVIGVIALLIGLLAPGLRGVRSAGRAMRCSTNLRQMAIAAQGYAAIYDAFPAAIRYELNDGGLRQIAWDWVTTMSGQLISSGPLWSFSDNPGEVQQCPDYHGSTNFDGDPYTGYNYNTTYLGAEALSHFQPGWDSVRPGVRPDACRRATQCALFGDGGWSGGTNKFMRAPMNSEPHPLFLIYAGGQAFRHRQSTNVAYLDGHVGPVDRVHPGGLATESLLNGIGYPENGFLSNDDNAYDPR